MAVDAAASLKRLGSKRRSLRGAAKQANARSRDLELRIWKLLEDGKTPSAIARDVGIARQSVHRIIRRVEARRALCGLSSTSRSWLGNAASSLLGASGRRAVVAVLAVRVVARAVTDVVAIRVATSVASGAPTSLARKFNRELATLVS